MLNTTSESSLSSMLELLGSKLTADNMMVVVAESCTGGGIASAMTSLPNSGSWFDRGFVTYTVDAKKEILGVKDATIEVHGVVSEQTAAEMVIGALANSHGNVGVAVTGVAGPDGADQKAVGTVCFAWSLGSDPIVTATTIFPGDRESVREQAIATGVHGLLELINNQQTKIL